MAKLNFKKLNQLLETVNNNVDSKFEIISLQELYDKDLQEQDITFVVLFLNVPLLFFPCHNKFCEIEDYESHPSNIMFVSMNNSVSLNVNSCNFINDVKSENMYCIINKQNNVKGIDFLTDNLSETCVYDFDNNSNTEKAVALNNVNYQKPNKNKLFKF